MVALTLSLLGFQILEIATMPEFSLHLRNGSEDLLLQFPTLQIEAFLLRETTKAVPRIPEMETAGFVLALEPTKMSITKLLVYRTIMLDTISAKYLPCHSLTVVQNPSDG